MKNKKVTLDPKAYYAAIYAKIGNYQNEIKFDNYAGLKWIKDYDFEIVDSEKWNRAKDVYELIPNKK